MAERRGGAGRLLIAAACALVGSVACTGGYRPTGILPPASTSGGSVVGGAGVR